MTNDCNLSIVTHLVYSQITSGFPEKKKKNYLGNAEIHLKFELLLENLPWLLPSNFVVLLIPLHFPH